MEKFVLAGKAKTVFQIIELMAKGEEFTKKQEAGKKIKGIEIDNSYQLWLASRQ